ncbi:TonB-dependent receptor [Luteimonas sp. Y-2-2-4F]|nr:TonB-dependent receptor [Luteimonas sp. Y-2-2-4F]MCD9032789.1 TonB-dependent receptor [Luteimonas sp. Y-2-2-4F]
MHRPVPLRSRSRTRRSLARTPLAAGILAGLIAAGPLHAQTAQPDAPDAPQAAARDGQRDAVELSSVIVTARKRDERQIDVPIALSAVTGEQIDAMGLLNVVDVLNSTAGASSIDTGGGFTQVQIRGVSSSLGGNDNGYYLDEIPFTGVSVPWYPDARSFDIDRVEVLKGPQGTLFGEGSMGGTVRIITRKPDFNYFNAGVELSAGTTEGGGDSWGGKAYVNVPLVEDTLALRVAVSDEKLGGWIDDNTTGDRDINEQRVKTGRFKLRFAPTERWNMDLSYWKYDSDAPGGGNSSLDDLSTNSYYSNVDEWDVSSFVTTYDFDGSQLFYSFADANLEYGNDGMLNPTTSYLSLIEIGVRTQELRWSSTGERALDWTVGYYLREAERNDSSSIGGLAPSASSQTNDAYALFGEVTYKLPNPAWAVTAGLRYFKDDVDAISISSDRVSTLNATFDSWNPRLSLSYKPQEDTTLYVSAARGFRSGQLQPITSILLAEQAGIELPSTIDPDSIMTYEFGAKSLLLDGKVMLEGAIFYSDWKDVAVRVPITDTINGLANSDGTENKGVEANIVYTPNRALTLQIGGSLIDATYSEDVPGTPLNRGTPVYNVPKTSLNGSVAYQWPVGGLRGVVRGGFVYDSKRETALTQGTPGDDILLLDARIGLESPSGWSAFLYGDNLTDEDGAINARSALGVANHPRPRSYGVLFRYTY